MPTKQWSYEGIIAYRETGDDLESVLTVQRAILHQNGPGVRYVTLEPENRLGTADGTPPEHDDIEHSLLDFQRVGVVCDWDDEEKVQAFGGIVHALPNPEDDDRLWFWDRWDDAAVQNPEAAGEWWHSQEDGGDA